MKIAMIGHKRIPLREGGIETVVEELSVRMAARGHEIHVYNRSLKSFERRKSYKGVRIITVPTVNWKGPEALLYSFLATIRALFGGYDVIHIHAEGPCAFIWLPRLLHIRTIVTVHGLDWQRQKWGHLAGSYIRLAERIAAACADEIIVLSRKMQEYFQSAYGRTTVYIPNGVNPAVLRPPELIKEKYGLSKDSYLLFLARIVPEKGLHYLLEAFRRIDTDKKLVVAGTGSHSAGYWKKVKEMAEQDKRVVMTGFVQGQELEELYSNCCLYVLPSDVEGMPVSLLEAMSFGCPCLTSDIEENMEITGDGAASHFKQGNIEDLIRALREALRQGPVYDPVKRNGVLKTAHSWDKIADSTLKLYSAKEVRRVKQRLKESSFSGEAYENTDVGELES